MSSVTHLERTDLIVALHQECTAYHATTRCFTRNAQYAEKQVQTKRNLIYTKTEIHIIELIQFIADAIIRFRMDILLET